MKISDKIQVLNTSRSARGASGSRVFPGILVLAMVVTAISLFMQGCGFITYSFKDVSIPDSVKTIKVNSVVNKARYINPQLAPQLSDKLRQKIVNQTKLSPTNNDADWEVSGEIVDYSISTSGISSQRVATSRLNVSMSITLYDRVTDDETKRTQTYNISRSFDFAANLTLQAAETQLLEEMIRNLTDEIFNQLFSKW